MIKPLHLFDSSTELTPFINQAIASFLDITDEIYISGVLLTFSRDRLTCLAGQTTDNHLYLIRYIPTLQVWSIIDTVVLTREGTQFRYTEKANFTTHLGSSTLSPYSLTLTGDGLKGAVFAITYENFGYGETLMLDLDVDIRISHAIVEHVDANDRCHGRVRYTLDGQLLLKSDPNNGCIMTIKSDKSESIGMPKAFAKINQYGLAVAVSDNNDYIVALGISDQCEDGVHPFYIAYTITKKDYLVHLEEHSDKYNVVTSMAFLPGYRYNVKPLIIDNTVYVIISETPILADESDPRLYVQRAYGATEELVCYTISGTPLELPNIASITRNMMQPMLSSKHVDGCITASDFPIGSGPKTVGVKTSPTEHLAEESDKIRSHPSKDNIMLRHQLIIQNILNNISLSIRNNERIKFSIGKMVITQDRISIQDLEFDNTGEED